MRRTRCARPVSFLAGLVGVGLCCSMLAAAAPDRPEVEGTAERGPFEVETLADGVFLFRPAGDGRTRTNSLVVRREDGLLVVDAQPTPEAARELLAAIGRVVPDPVRYVVITHPYADSAGGASSFPDSTLIVGSRRCREALEDESFNFGGSVRARASDPASWIAPEKRLPTLVLFGRTRLEDPRNPVELLPLGPTRTPGDLMVDLPEQSILYAGALLFVDRNPYCADAKVGAWLGVLNQIARSAPAVVVPMRGRTVDVRSVRGQRDSLAWLRGQIEAAFIGLVPPVQIPATVLRSPDLGNYFDAEAEPSFLSQLIDLALEEALQNRRKRGWN